MSIEKAFFIAPNAKLENKNSQAGFPFLLF